VSIGSSTAFTAAKTILQRYHRLAAMEIVGWYIPLTTTRLTCVPEMAPSDQVSSLQSATEPPAFWQLVSYCVPTAVRLAMSRCESTRITSSRAEIEAGSKFAASSTMIIPAAPPPAWIAVDP